MTQQAIALTLSIGGVLNSSASRAFSGAGRLFDGVGRRINKLEGRQADLRKELARVRKAQDKAFDTADVEEYRREVERLERELKGAGKQLDRLYEGRNVGRGRRLGGLADVAAGLGLANTAAQAFNLTGRATERAREAQRAGLTSGLGSDAVQEIANFGVASGALEEQGAIERAADIGRELRNRLGEAALDNQGATFDILQRLGLDAETLLGDLESDALGTILNLGNAITEGLGSQAQFGLEEVFGGAEGEFLAGFTALTRAEQDLTRERAQRRPAFSEEEIALLVEAGNATRELTGSAGALGKTLAIAIAPVMQSIAEFLTPIVNGIIMWAKENPQLAKTLTLVGVGLTAAIAAILGVASSIAIATAAWTALNLAFLFSPIGLIILAIVAAVAILVAIGLVLWHNWDSIMSYLSGLWDGFLDTVNSVIDGVKGAWNSLLSAILSGARTILIPIFETVTKVANAVGGALAAVGIGEGFDLDSDALAKQLDRAERTLTLETSGGRDGAVTQNTVQPAVSETNVTVNVNAPTQEELPDLTANAVGAELAFVRMR